MKIFISADIEGINSIVNWQETELNEAEYQRARHEMTKEVRAACEACHDAGVEEIFIKDAHDSARNLIIEELPEYVKLHRAWQGSPQVMMAGIEEGFDGAIYIGYHSEAQNPYNSLSHTMNGGIMDVTINGIKASEFVINSYMATYYKVPSIFLAGDKALTESAKALFNDIETVASKEGLHGAVVSKHPTVTYKEIYDGVTKALKKDLKAQIQEMPKSFDIKIQYKSHIDAYRYSFFPGCKLIGPTTVQYKAKNYYDCMVLMKFIL